MVIYITVFWVSNHKGNVLLVLLVAHCPRYKDASEYALLSIIRAYIGSTQLFVPGTCWAARKLGLPKQLHLSLVARGVLLVAPPPVPVKPVDWCIVTTWGEGVAGGIESIVICRKERIPKCAVIGVVL